MGYTSKKKMDELIHDCFRELYEKSTPSGDFDKLVEHAKKHNVVNERGEFEIPMDDYEIDPDLFDEIVDKYAKQIYPVWKRQYFKNTFYLGATPKYKRK